MFSGKETWPTHLGNQVMGEIFLILIAKLVYNNSATRIITWSAIITWKGRLIWKVAAKTILTESTHSCTNATRNLSPPGPSLFGWTWNTCTQNPGGFSESQAHQGRLICPSPLEKEFQLSGSPINFMLLARKVGPEIATDVRHHRIWISGRKGGKTALHVKFWIVFD